MARSLADSPLLIVTAYRPGDEDDWPPPVERALTLKLPIGPLDECETAALVEAVAGRRPSTDLVDRLYDRSGGNPLFLTELAQLTASVGDEDVDVALPGTLRALIAARLDQLAPAQRAILDNAAILGTEGPIGAFAEFAEALGQVFDERLVDDLVVAGMLEVEGRRWQFRSDVVREVAYQTLTKQARAQRHAGVATHLATLGKVPLDDLAHHAATAAELLEELGSVPGVSSAIRLQAVDLLARAARQSYEIGAFPRGVAASERALSLVGDDDDARRSLRLLYASGLVEMRALDSARVRAGGVARRSGRRRRSRGGRRDASAARCRRATRRRSRRRPREPRSRRRHLPRARRRPPPRDCAAGERVRRDLRWFAGRRRVVPRRGRRDLRPCRRRARTGLGPPAPRVGRVPEWRSPGCRDAARRLDRHVRRARRSGRRQLGAWPARVRHVLRAPVRRGRGARPGGLGGSPSSGATTGARR